MRRSATLPFTLARKNDVLTSTAITSTKESVHGILNLDGDRLIIQWRLARKTEHVGNEIRTDTEYEPVKEVVVPLTAVAGARVRRRWWHLWTGHRIVVTASDLKAFEKVTGEAGLKLAHPAELVLRLRRADDLPAEEFCAELALALAERALEGGPGSAHRLTGSMSGKDDDTE